MKEKFPIKIVINNEGKFRATTSLDKIYDSTNIRHELSFIEMDYTILINTIHSVLSGSSKKKTDPRLFWLIGENIVRFFEHLEEMGFYLVQQNRTLSRDIRLSETSIKKIVSFYKRFPKISMIDPAIPWSKYRGNKVPLSSEPPIR